MFGFCTREQNQNQSTYFTISVIACVSAAEPDLITGVRFDKTKPRGDLTKQTPKEKKTGCKVDQNLQQKMLSVTGVSLSVTLLATQVPCKDVVRIA